jgi:hypothetical protein
MPQRRRGCLSKTAIFPIYEFVVVDSRHKLRLISGIGAYAMEWH